MAVARFRRRDRRGDAPRNKTALLRPERLTSASLLHSALVNVSVEEMTRDPGGVLDRVREGETLVVVDHDQPVAEIRPIERVRRPRPFGLAAGTFVVPDDFDDPLPEDVLRDFEQ